MKRKNILNRLIQGNRVYMTLIIIHIIVWGTLQTSYAEEKDTKEPEDIKIERLEKAVNDLMDEIKKLKEDRKAKNSQSEERDKRISSLEDMVEKPVEAAKSAGDTFTGRFSLGGYGEMHANFTSGSDKDLFDIHRLVLYLGYSFSDWIKFHSEIELEHAFVSNSDDGEIGFEQAYVDFLFNESINIRAGRILTPLGIINKKHEPPSFNGVERPSFSKYIIPSTWSADGAGIFGRIKPSLKYEAYIVGGLDGSGFNAKNGIRGGRIKDRPGLNELSFTGRLDFYPLLHMEVTTNHQLRTGISMFYGGLDNGSNGSNPGIDGNIGIYSADFEYSYMDFDLSGAAAYEKIDGALSIGNGTASEIFGWYLEAGYHFWQERFKNGLLSKSDAVFFVRYDDYDTQYKMPAGITENPEGDRSEVTIGLNFYPVPNFVIKADYQIRDDESEGDPDNLFNLGIGWQF